MPIESDLVVSALDKVQIQVEEYFRATRQQVRGARSGREGAVGKHAFTSIYMSVCMSVCLC